VKSHGKILVQTGSVDSVRRQEQDPDQDSVPAEKCSSVDDHGLVRQLDDVMRSRSHSAGDGDAVFYRCFVTE